MDEEKRPLSEEEAIAFAGVTESTLHRYISAGFINPVVEGEQRFFDEDELIQVFELSPKRAAASRKALKKKALSPAEKLISEKDRLVADKDIQIRDLKDQRSWLQSRVERLEAELLALKNKQNTPQPAIIPPGSTTSVPVQQNRETLGPTEALSEKASSVSEVSTQEQDPRLEATQGYSEEISVAGSATSEPSEATLIAPAAIPLSPQSELESKSSVTTQHAESSLKKVLRYLGFIKPEPASQQPAITSRASEIIALDRTGERVATVPPSDEPAPDNLAADSIISLRDANKPQERDLAISDNIIEVKFPAPPSADEASLTQPGVNQTPLAPATRAQPLRGNRPFRESKQTLAELLGDDRPLDPSFAANDESEQ